MNRLTAATCTLVSTLALAACATVPGEDAQMRGAAAAETVRELAAGAVADQARNAVMNQGFEVIGKAYVTSLSALNPVYATALGDHSFDDRLPDVGPVGREADLEMAQELLGALAQIDPSVLSRQNQVDYALLKNALEYQVFATAGLQEWAWNPQVYNSLASQALYGLVAREFAPFAERYPNIIARMEAMPAMLAQAREQIDVARVPKVHAETVSAQNAGLLQIVDEMIAPEVEASGVDRSAFDAARTKLAAAVAENQTWLDEVVVPGAKGDFRLGTDLYDKKMRFGLVSDVTRSEVKARATSAYDEARAEMERIARTFADCDVAGQQAAIQCALEKSYERRAGRGTLEAEAAATLETATAFTAKEGFVKMPDSAVEIITMPKFYQGNAVAYLDSPAPLEKHLPAFYAISPIPDDWSEEQATSFLKEYNWYMLHELSIHEGVPGHYLQINLANKFPSTLRSVLASSPFAEGWAVYSERVMAERGYLGGMDTVDGRLFRLTMLKMRLRSITNTLLDIGIHTEGMTREQAMEMMTVGGFQQEREAAGKWIRGNLSSVQLLSYFTGYSEHLALREEAKQRWGADYDERKYHDAVLSHGSPPVKYARALVLDLPIE